VRSRAAASVLARAGFKAVYSMEGGIRAWEGVVAEGFPETFTVLFAGAKTVGELIGIAWLLEDGARVFYEEAAKAVGESEDGAVFMAMSVAEERHEAVLSKLHQTLTGTGIGKSSLELRARGPGNLMEGGAILDEALSWVRGKSMKTVSEFAIGLETNAYDRFLYMKRSVSDDQARRVFEKLAQEEKTHLERMTALFAKFL
jgi:sulfur-carrier protein adenylyltransferase/sulfurtransferase